MRKKRQKFKDIFQARTGQKHKRLEKLIHELRAEDPHWLIIVLCNAVVDVVFDVTGEGNRGGAP